MPWKVGYISIHPTAGTIEEVQGNWVYTLQNPADKDSFVFSLTNTETGQSGIFTVDVNIEPDPGILSIPGTVTEGDTEIIFNAGVRRPAELTFTIDGIEGSFKAGEVVRIPNARIEVIPNYIYEITGPGAGGGIYAVGTHKNYPDLVFASCDMGGCYRSTNGGEYWIMYNKNILKEHHMGPGPQIFPDGKTIVWPGKGISGGTDKVMVSYDTGVTWDKAAVLPIRSVTLTNSTLRYNSPICAAPFAGGCLIGTKLDGLLLFNLNDYSFTIIDGEMEIGADGDARGVWFLEVEDNYGYYVTGKDIRKFTYIDGSFSTETLYTATDYIVGFGYSNGIFLITIKNDGVYSSENNGVSWTKVDDFNWQIWLHVTPLGTFYSGPCNPFYLYTTDVFSLTTTDRAGKPLWKSTDKGTTWSNIFNISSTGNVERSWIQSSLSWSYYFMLNGFAVIPGATPDEDILWASSQGEIFKTVNGGKTWTTAYRKTLESYQSRDRSYSIGLEVTSCRGVQEDLHDPNIWHGAWEDIGGQFSPDKGKSWVYASTGIPSTERNSRYNLALDPKVPGRMWSAQSRLHDILYDGFLSTYAWQGGIYMSTDYGLTWSVPYARGVDGPKSQICTDIVYDHNTDALYAAIWGQTHSEEAYNTYNNSGVWKSIDFGASWERKVNGLDPNDEGNLHIFRIQVGPSGSIFALKTMWQTTIHRHGGLFRSRDGGDNWEFIGPEGPEGSLWHKWLTSFAFGKTEDEIYVTAVDNLTASVGLMVTYDGGVTWKNLWSKDMFPYGYDYMMSIYVEGDFLILGGVRTGPWLSWDGGKSWDIWRDYPFHNIQKVTKLRDGRLACASHGAGYVIMEMPGKSGCNIQPYSGTLKITKLNDTPSEFTLNFTLTDSQGKTATTTTKVQLD